ncbi:MAG: hypothetical protein HAW62_00785 [Endozoicomonadaceae bacterium]|nr:hypothetical protein [Endozoicomonadaceae bacterium]
MISVWLQYFVKLCRCLTLKALSSSVLESISLLGHKHYHHANFDVASNIFRYLCLYDSDSIDYLILLGICEFKKNRYYLALEAFHQVLLIQSNPKASFYSALIYLILNQRDLAQQHLLDCTALLTSKS